MDTAELSVDLVLVSLVMFRNSDSDIYIYISAGFVSIIGMMSGLKGGPPSLVSLCLGVVGSHLEEIVPCLSDISDIFPADIKVYA